MGSMKLSISAFGRVKRRTGPPSEERNVASLGKSASSSQEEDV